MQKCCVWCFYFCKCIVTFDFALRTFVGAKMHLMPKMHFGNASHFKGKCSASHFPKENVQHHIFQGKCSTTVHFPKENVQFYLEQPTFS